MPGTTRLIDLSVTLEDNAVSEPMPARIDYMRHAVEGLQWFKERFGVAENDLVYSDGVGGTWETFQGITHTGTHLDAPWHFGPTSEGRPAKTIDEVPLEWCFGDGVVLDLRHKRPGEFITVADLEACLQKIGYTIKPFDIVLLMTGCDKRIDSPAYFDQPGMSREATLWLLEQGVKIVGIDAYGFDRKFADMAADFQRTGDGRFVWPAHFAGITKEYCHIEKMANLDQIPRPFGFKIAVFPVKIKGASAGWVRPVAFVDEEG
jgi:kynurenine formamidase